MAWFLKSMPLRTKDIFEILNFILFYLKGQKSSPFLTTITEMEIKQAAYLFLVAVLFI